MQTISPRFLMPVIMPNALTECKTEVSYLVLTTLGTYM